MNDSYFSATRDREVIEAGGFFCEACLVGKPLDDVSPDPRYCLGCYEFLLKETELLGRVKKASWLPAVDYSRRSMSLPIQQEPVAKIPDKGYIPLQKNTKRIMQQRGRPRKVGEVHRTTEWRRKKETQGVLV